MMARLFKTSVSALMIAALAMGAMPADARGRWHHDHHRRDKISAGEVIAGAVIIGGLAAILSSAAKRDREARRNEDRGYDDRGYDDGRYGDRGYESRSDGYDQNDARDYEGAGYGGSRGAVDQCVAAVESEGSRDDDRARVSDIRDIRQTRYGYEVSGTAVRTEGDRRARSQSDLFRCSVEQGRIVAIDYGSSGWR